MRAFNPWPVTYTMLGDKVLRSGKRKRVWRSEDADMDRRLSLEPSWCHAGKGGIDVATGAGTLRLLRVQLRAAARSRSQIF